MITMVTNDYKVIVNKMQDIEKKWRGDLMKTTGLVKLRFPTRVAISGKHFNISLALALILLHKASYY